MKRSMLFVATAAALALAFVPAHAGHSTSGSYTVGTTPGVSVVCSPDCLGEPGLNIGGYTFAAEGEIPISVAIADTSMGPVSYTVCQDFDGALCGETGEPRVQGCGTAASLATSLTPFTDAHPVSVFVRLVNNDCLGGIASGGTITLTFAAPPV